MPKVAFYTLGCKVNQYETEAMMRLFRDAGYKVVDFEEAADVYVINTCTVTNMGDRKSRQIIRRAIHNNPEAVVAVVGCYTQRAPDEVLAIPGVDVIVGTDDRHRIVELVERAEGSDEPVNAVKDISQVYSFEELSLDSYEGRTRAFVKIEEGCDRYCTYCIIPYARGPVRSREPENVMDEVRRLAQAGFKEIVLTGIHIASYGKDLEGITLIDIIEMVHSVNGIERIRLSSVEPTILTERFIERIKALPKVCPHYHVSLQSGCDATLHRMGRRYTTQQYREIINLLRQNIPDVAITTDVMVGFPGETDEEFALTYDFVKEIAFSQIHVFPYSPRKGTAAARFRGQVSPKVKEQRAKALIALGHELRRHFMERHVGVTLPVLFEQPIENGLFEGLTPNYIHVLARADDDVHGCILDVYLNDVGEDWMTGIIVKR